jgi:hypothetical protein
MGICKGIADFYGVSRNPFVLLNYIKAFSGLPKPCQRLAKAFSGLSKPCQSLLWPVKALQKPCQSLPI